MNGKTSSSWETGTSITDGESLLRPSLQGAPELLQRTYRSALHAVRLCELDEVGDVLEPDADEASVVHQPLPLLHHPKAPVVDDYRDDREPLLDRRGEGLFGHDEAAVAVEVDDRDVGAANFAPMAAGSPNPIVPSPVEVIQVLGLQDLVVYLAPHLVPAHARGEYGLRGKDVPHHLDDLGAGELRVRVLVGRYALELLADLFRCFSHALFSSFFMSRLSSAS